MTTYRDYAKLGVFECIGTFLLTVAMNFGYRQPEIISSGIFVAVLMTYRITGSHLNAAITIGVYLIRSKWKQNIYCLIIYLVC